jgi:predicted DCC family thiol-disulfide oxidoreductase YuxK
MNQLKPLTLYYDGACPLCQAEIIYLSSRNQRGLLHFIDINSEAYDLNQLGISCQQALERMYGKIHGELPIYGVSVFAEAYRRVDLKLLAWIFSVPLFKPLLHLSYRIFAKYRHAISAALGPMMLRIVKSKLSKN